jgi:hypothetical protein
MSRNGMVASKEVTLSTEARTALAHIAKGDKLISEINNITERLHGAEAKAEQHYMAAALIFKKIKAEHIAEPRHAAWKKVCQKKCGLARRRVDELIELADGRRSLADQRKRSRLSHTKSRAKKGAGQDRRPAPSAPKQLDCDADPRIDYRSRLVNLLLEAENIAQEFLDPQIVVFDFAGLVIDAEQVAASWNEVVSRYRGLAKNEGQQTLIQRIRS